ncbi:MAG: acetyl-CoA carboxylase, carboxyltransferase subunit beta [Chlamydiota bacterium]
MGFLRLFTKHKPKIKVESTKRDGFSGWVKCSQCTEMVHSKEMQENHQCCPKCGYHYRFSAIQRIELLADKGTFQEFFTNLHPTDPLLFSDTESYEERMKRAQEKTKRTEAVYVGSCLLKNQKIALGVMDFGFMGGSMGSVVGEKITRLIEYAIDNQLPVVIVCSSGGARMQESCLSLMQMAKTSAALAKLHEKGLPYISVLTNPTTGGVTASFAALGDVIIAEPDALIGFAGPRVVEQIIRQKLPPTAQKSELLLEKGMIDCIVSRADLKEKLAFFLSFLAQKTTKSTLPHKLQELLIVAKDKDTKITYPEPISIK